MAFEPKQFYTKKLFEMYSAKWQPFCPSLSLNFPESNMADFQKDHLFSLNLGKCNWNCKASYSNPGDCLNIKMSSYQYRDSHVKDKTVSRPSFLKQGNLIPGKDGLYIESGALDVSSLLNNTPLSEIETAVERILTGSCAQDEMPTVPSLISLLDLSFLEIPSHSLVGRHGDLQTNVVRV